MRVASALLIAFACVIPSASAQAQGETFTNAFVIPSLPYYSSGSSCHFANDVENGCDSEGPDVVYAFTPTRTMCVSIQLCGDYIPPVVKIYTGSPPAPVGCRYFACGVPLEAVMTAGVTYWIVVDGTAGFGWASCGYYQLDIMQCGQNCTSCPTGAIPENEVCNAEYSDDNNSGCDYPGYEGPIATKSVAIDAAPVTVCGAFGLEPGRPDHDWYKVAVTEPATLRAGLTTDLESALTFYSLAQPIHPCQRTVVAPTTIVPPCVPTSSSAVVPPGEYYVVVVPTGSMRPGCDQEYALELSAQPLATDVTGRSWGQLKLKYR